MLEQLNKSFYAKDLTIQEYECQADRLGALAFSDRLGAALIRATATNKSLQDVIQALAKKIAWLESNSELRAKIASLAIAEWLFKNCQSCNGNGSGRNQTGLLIECPDCSGSGHHRFTDKDRSNFIKSPWTPRLNRVLGYAESFLTGAISSSLNDVKRQLDRL